MESQSFPAKAFVGAFYRDANGIVERSGVSVLLSDFNVNIHKLLFIFIVYTFVVIMLW